MKRSMSDKSVFQPYLSRPFPDDFSHTAGYGTGSPDNPDMPSGDDDDDDDDEGITLQEPSQHVFQSVGPAESSGRVPERQPVKHRRSRKGCFTCRARKVKCDETRPVCIRCRKACKECKFPEETGPSKDRKAPAPAREEPQTEPLRVEDESTPSLTHSKSSESLGRSETPSTQPKSLPESLSMTRTPTARPRSVPGSLGRSEEASTSPAPAQMPSMEPISAEMQFYLDFYQKEMSYHHFQWNYDCCNFITSYLVLQAQAFEPLLYAVVALAAYMYTVNRKPNGTLQDFLPFYSKSLLLLRTHLESSNGTLPQFLMTMLTLALIEGYFGDLVNLTSHQNAARRIITAAYTPETMTESVYMTKILDWYLHFDLYMGLLSGNESIDQRWFLAVHTYWDKMKKEHSENKEYGYEERFSATRVLAAGLGNLTVSHRHSPPDDPDFRSEAEALSRQVTAWYKDLEAPDFDLKQVLENPSVAPPTSPSTGNIWPYCSTVMKFWSCELLLKLQLAKIPNYSDDVASEVAVLAGKLCKMYEAFKNFDPTPGAAIGMFSVLGPAGFVLAKSLEGCMWYRRQLAATESSGIVFSRPYRQRFSAVLQIDSDWWLPNEEMRTPIIKAVRQFADDRTNESNVQQERHKDLASLAGFFDKMSISTPPRG